jgi:hypothetical protein
MPFKIPTVVLLLLLAFNDRTVCEALQIDITNFSTPTTRFAMTLLELEDHPWLPRNVVSEAIIPSFYNLLKFTLQIYQWDVRKYTYASKDFMNKHDDETQDSNSHQSRSNYFIDLIQFNGSSMVCEENGFVTFSGYGLRENAKIASTVQLRDPPGQFVYFVCTKTQMLTFYDNHLVDANYGCSSQAADPHTAICEYVVGMQFTLTSVGSYVWSDEWVTTQQDDYVPLIVKCNETATINPTNVQSCF